MKISQYKIAMVVTYFGKFPEYMPYFLQTCAYNKSIDFLIFCDTKPIYEIDSVDNIRFFDISIKAFNALASQKLAIPIVLEGGYKLCDLKPMYGKIYEDKLLEYDFWGFCDVDLLLGDIRKVLPATILMEYDVISAHSQYLSGPFSLFRNTEAVNILFTKSKDWMRVATENKVFLFDEASNVIRYLWEGDNIFDHESEIESMTHLLMGEKKGSIKVLFAGFITERLSEYLSWNNGKLFDEKGKELSVFHYIVYKSKLNFTVPHYKGDALFYFNKSGFYLTSLKSKTLDRGKALLTNLLHKVYRKITKNSPKI